jgi:hypothetical protein
MKSSEQTKEIFTALVEARNSIAGLPKSRDSYTNKYIPLDDVVDHLKQVLPKYGLGYVQLPEGGTGRTIGLCTRIIHSSGQWVESAAEFALTNMKSVNVSQEAGAAISYFRRYALCAAFGIVADDDTDGNIDAPAKPAQSKKQAPADADRERCIKAYNILKMTPEQLVEAKEKHGGSYKKTAEYLEGLIADKEAQEAQNV